jgi:hypothetical protein
VADGANDRKADLAFPEIATISDRLHARSDADNAHDARGSTAYMSVVRPFRQGTPVGQPFGI